MSNVDHLGNVLDEIKEALIILNERVFNLENKYEGERKDISYQIDKITNSIEYIRNNFQHDS